MSVRSPKMRSPWRAAAATAAVVSWLAPALVFAGDEPYGADTGAVSLPAANARRSVETGALAPWSMAARSDTQRAFALVMGGYDAAKKGSFVQSVVEAQVYGRLSLRAGASYVGPSGEARPTFAAKVDALRQESHGIDLAIAGGYEAHGFNTVPALAVLVSAGRNLGSTTLLANVGYGAGIRNGERYGDARFAAMQRVSGLVHLGLDSRFRLDLERDTSEPAGEPDWELVSGPLATLNFGRFVVSGGAGVSVVRMRLESESLVGALAHVGAGAVF